jgi:hypothetical protein
MATQLPISSACELKVVQQDYTTRPSAPRGLDAFPSVRLTPVGAVILSAAVAVLAWDLAAADSRPTPPVPSTPVANAPGYCPSQGGSRTFEDIAAVETTPQRNGSIRIQVDVVLGGFNCEAQLP